MGAPEDVTRVRSQLVKHAERLGLGPVDAPVEESRQDENAERLARLREKYARKYAKRVAHA